MREESEERLVKFVISVYKLCEGLTDHYPVRFLSNKLMHAASVATLNYGEAGYAIHPDAYGAKIRQVNTWLREIHIHLQILFLAFEGEKNALLIELLEEICSLQKLFEWPVETMDNNLFQEVQGKKL